MQNFTIISHLTPREWKNSWADKVIEDTTDNMKEYQSQSCFWGHFISDSEFIICYHGEFEIKGMSLSQYFNGTIESDEKGSKIVGSFSKKWSANLFLIVGAIFCLMAIFGWRQFGNGELGSLLCPVVLLAIIVGVYFMRPKNKQRIVTDYLKKISFDDKYHDDIKKIKEEEKAKKADEEPEEVKETEEVKEPEKETESGESL